jgi:hypothetical protein
MPRSEAQSPVLPEGLPQPGAGSTQRPDTPSEAVFREAIKLMDDLAGVRAAMAMLAAEGHAPGATQVPSRPDSAPAHEHPSPVPAPEQAPLAGGAPSGAAGAGPSGGSGSAALYALVIALAALAGGLWGRLELVPVRWRSVAIVALNERPG